MKILFISPYPLKSGIISAYIQNYKRKYIELGHSVIYEKVYFWENKILYSLKWLLLLRYVFNPGMVFLLHQHTIPASGPMIIPFLLVLRLLGRKVIVVSHETVQTYAKHLPDPLKWVAYLYERCIVVLSSYYIVHTRIHKNESEWFKNSSKVKIIPHPVPKVTAITGERKLWGFYGMISEKKGVDLFIDAYQSVQAGSFPKLRIMGAAAPGEEAYVEYCKKLVKETHSRYITFSGFVKEEHKPELFSDVSLMVFPYRYVSQSGALAETCMYRIPYLASDIPFFSEFNAAYGCGALFNSDNTESLTSALKKIADNPLNIEKQKFDLMETELSIERCAGAFTHLLKNEE